MLAAQVWETQGHPTRRDGDWKLAVGPRQDSILSTNIKASVQPGCEEGRLREIMNEIK